MDARTWLGLEPTHNPHRWWLPVTAGISTGHKFLFGGCALGAAIAAMEGTTGRPLVWATAQYLSFAPVDAVLDIDVEILVTGHQTTQARAVCHVGGSVVITVDAALGVRGNEFDDTYVGPPDVAPPVDCPPRVLLERHENSLMSRMEQRWANPVGSVSKRVVPLGPGRSAVWTRMPELLEPSAAALGVLGDFVPMGIHIASGQRTGSNSLDNTLRVMAVEPSDWFLLDITVVGIRNGFGHGHVNIWSEDGTLLAVGSQSCVVRASR